MSVSVTQTAGQSASFTPTPTNDHVPNESTSPCGNPCDNVDPSDNTSNAVMDLIVAVVVIVLLLSLSTVGVIVLIVMLIKNRRRRRKRKTHNVLETGWKSSG